MDAEALARRRRERRDRAKNVEVDSGEDSEGPHTQGAGNIPLHHRSSVLNHCPTARGRSRTPFRVLTPTDEDAEPDQYVNGEEGKDSDSDQDWLLNRNYYGENIDKYGQVIDDNDNPEDIYETLEHIDEDAGMGGEYAAHEDAERYEYEWDDNEPQDDREEDEPQDDGEEDEPQDDGEEDEPQDDEPYDDEEEDDEDEEQGEYYGLQVEDEQAQDEDSEPMPGALQTKACTYPSFIRMIFTILTSNDPAQGKLSASQRRHVKRTNVRRQIDSYSQRASTSRHTSKRRCESHSPPR